MSDKNYVKGFFCKEVPTQFGNIYNASFKFQDFFDWANENSYEYNGEKWFNFSICKSKNPKGKSTHYGIKNEYKKTDEQNKTQNETQNETQQEKENELQKKFTDDDLPF